MLTTVCSEKIFKLHVPDLIHFKVFGRSLYKKLLGVMKSEVTIFIFITFFFSLKLQSYHLQPKQYFKIL